MKLSEGGCRKDSQLERARGAKDCQLEKRARQLEAKYCPRCSKRKTAPLENRNAPSPADSAALLRLLVPLSERLPVGKACPPPVRSE